MSSVARAELLTVWGIQKNFSNVANVTALVSYFDLNAGVEYVKLLRRVHEYIDMSVNSCL